MLLKPGKQGGIAMACKTGDTTCKTSGEKSKAKRKTIQSTEFTVTAPEAQEVYLAGNFNEWNASEFAMRKFKGGRYVKKMKLKPGRYEYLFVIDGEWCPDPTNPARQIRQILLA